VLKIILTCGRNPECTDPNCPAAADSWASKRHASVPPELTADLRVWRPPSRSTPATCDPPDHRRRRGSMWSADGPVAVAADKFGGGDLQSGWGQTSG
jgi:hypothetical protein